MTAPVRAIGHAEVGDAKQSWRDFLTARLDPPGGLVNGIRRR